MKRALMFLICLLPSLALAAPQVSVRSELLNGDKALVGGTVTLQVDVLVDTWFSSPPELPRLAIDGAVVTPPSGEAQHLTEKQQGQTLFGLRFNYQITPLNAQAYDIPALSVRVTPGQSQQPVTVSTTAQHFSAAQPAGAKAGESSLIAQQVELTQTIVKSHDPLRVGDSITRQVQTRAVGAQTMLIPAPPFADIKGLTRYVQPPSVHPLEDGRGGVNGGAREDSVMYRVTEEGHFSVPAIEVPWWSAADGQAHSASVPAITFEAKGEASYQAPFSMAQDLRALRHSAQVNIARHWLVIVAVLIIGAALVYFGKTRARALWVDWLQRRERRQREWLNSPEYAWQLTRQQLAAQPPRLDGLYLWVRRSTGRVDLQSFIGSRRLPLMQRLQRWFANLYAAEKSAQPEPPAALLEDLQKVHQQHATRTSARYHLKPLNPQSTYGAIDESERHASVS
jgi:hypothetical protein